MAAGTLLALILLLGALVVIAWLLVEKARHPFTSADLAKARKDSIPRSLSVVSGKVGEQLAPLFPEFLEKFNRRMRGFWAARSISSSSTASTRVRCETSC